MADFSIEGTRFKSKPLGPKIQLRVLKRLARIAPSIKDASAFASSLKEGQRPSLDAMADTLAPIVTAFADMPDDDVEFVMDVCMQATEWCDPTGHWFPVQGPSGAVSHQDNANLIRSITITWHVLRDNLAPLFSSLVPAAVSAP